MPKKTKTKVVKPMNTNIPGYKQPSQHSVERAQRPDKITPKEIFEMMDGKKSSKPKKKSKKY